MTELQGSPDTPTGDDVRANEWVSCRVGRADDPEMFDGRTIWGDGWATQVRGNGVVLYFERKGGGVEYGVSLDDARRLRDLLNVATARRFL